MREGMGCLSRKLHEMAGKPLLIMILPIYEKGHAFGVAIKLHRGI